MLWVLQECSFDVHRNSRKRESSHFFVLEVHAKYSQMVVKIPQTGNFPEPFESFPSESRYLLNQAFQHPSSQTSKVTEFQPRTGCKDC